ncbi:hypothetical protein [Citrobacter sp. TSA-1]|uniref:hypothetical protein n=1 Tax=Citrobacter sp. TSA-1 TaxID=184912 RepID=UPI000BAE3D3C|nr:hypothetical protein [Citrobacter sp. TSA-1]PAX81063.1 hypothetical protein CIK43_04100 [Citrobacter sp. TSA-1]QKE22694.1 hypothetical protein HF677_023780 [Citrobacter sp. TSA-1]
MADWFIATEGVKVVKDSASLWPQIITAVSSAGAAFGGVWYGQWRITQREAKAAACKRDEERLYISTELVFLLEKFAEDCARIATDTGRTDAQGFNRSSETTPDIDLSVVSGDWRVLPPRLMYAIRELPVLKEWSDREIAGVEESEGPPDYIQTSLERQYLYARLGLKAILQARRLRKLASLPGTRLDATKWSAQPVLWKVWRDERKRRAQEHILRQRNIAVYKIKMQQHYESRRNRQLNSGETP